MDYCIKALKIKSIYKSHESLQLTFLSGRRDCFTLLIYICLQIYFLSEKKREEWYDIIANIQELFESKKFERFCVELKRN